MNDFTKEELKLLGAATFSSWMRSLTDPVLSSEVKNGYSTLKDKLESMIDNYCEHDGEVGKDYPAEKCMKCNKVWE